MARGYSPDVRVELDVTGGYATPVASRTWVDVTPFVVPARGITIQHGRSDEFATADANTCTLTLDNTDGRFTAGYAKGALFPGIRVGNALRVTVTPQGEADSIRFTGYVDSWPTTWDGSDAYSEAPITAVSRLSRLGRGAALGDLVRAEYLADSPWGYWPLAGRQELTGQRGRLGFRGEGDKPTFDAPGVSYSGRSAADFSRGRALWKTSGALPGGSVTVEAAVRVEDGERGVLWAFYSGPDPAADPVYYAEVRPTGVVRVGSSTTSIPLSYTITSSVTIDDGLWHHVAVVRDGSIVTLYIDGVSQGTDSPVAYALGSGFSLGAPEVDENPIYTEFGLTGQMAHFAIHSGALTSSRIAAHASVVTLGQTGATAATRLGNLADLADVPVAERSIDAAATTTITGQIVGRAQPLALMRAVETTEGGVLHDGRDGSLTYRSFAGRYDVAHAHIFDMKRGQVIDWEPTLDRTTLTNTVTATNPDTELEVTVTDAASVDEYGPHASDLTLLLPDLAGLESRAQWLVDHYAEPVVRVPSLSCELVVLEPPDQTSILGLDVASRVRVDNVPRQAAETITDFFVEGTTETIGPHSYRLELNLSPAEPFIEE